MPCDLAAIAAIARRHGLPLIEDAACAAGSEIRWEGNWERIGTPHGDIACFSFHPRKLHDDRRRRHADDGQPRVRSAVPPLAPAQR